MSGRLQWTAVAVLLGIMFLLSGGAALRESSTVDEVAHIGAGLSYWQRLDMRMNPEHPPLGKLLAALPLAIGGARADYSGPAWRISDDFFAAFGCQYIFGDAVVQKWNGWRSTLAWARFPLLFLTLVLGFFVYRYGRRLGGPWGGLLCLAAYAATPAFLVFGPLVITDLPVTLFFLISLWRLGEIWDSPSRRNAFLFGVALAAALLSKFTALLLFLVIPALFLQTRIWPTAAQPKAKEERKAWRGARWRCAIRGCLWAALFVYGVCFLFTWNQPDNALSLVGSGRWAWILRRPLMPLWVYLRGVGMMLLMGSRPTFILGRILPHGVPYYFPVAFALKSTLSFLLLLLTAAVAAILHRRSAGEAIPKEVRPHWRVLMVGFFVVLAVCLLSQMDISIRHFMVPIVLLILMLAPLPRMIGARRHPGIWRGAAVALAATAFVPVILAYPYLLPLVNSLSFGRPAYSLLNDSNVSWNEALPEVERFAREQKMSEIALDFAAISEPTAVVPQARPWDCQDPTAREAGRWVAVAAVAILEDHNCEYLRQYPSRALAGGSYYVFRLPDVIPAAGAPGGPPAEQDRRIMWGLPLDYRSWMMEMERHPERLAEETPKLLKRMRDEFEKQQQAAKAKSARR